MDTWESFVEACLECRKCPLCETRTNVVVGRGANLKAPLMFIGKAPASRRILRDMPLWEGGKAPGPCP